MTVIDSHCHLDDHQFDEDREAVIERALAAGVEWMMSIGTGDGPPDLEVGIRLADSTTRCWRPSASIPHDAPKAADDDFARVRELLQHPKVVAVGEIGLDYYWQPVHRDEQHRVFIRQMEIAREARKPISIHTRDAWDDTFALLEEHWDGRELPCILHCFGGGPGDRPEGARPGLFPELRRHGHLSEGDERPGGGEDGAARPHSGRDRRAVPRSRAASRQAQ